MSLHSSRSSATEHSSSHARQVLYSPAVLDRLQAVKRQPWEGTAFRHMWLDYPPDRENTRGARWNPPEVPAIYASLSREGALAEAEHQIAMQPLRPRGRRTLYALRIALATTLDLTEDGVLSDLGIGSDELTADDMVVCREVGGAAAWLEADGILVPSARGER
jgi:RES domain-containing protein